MNLILLTAEEVDAGLLAAADRRCQHLNRVLKVQAGQHLRAGLIGGDCGQLELRQWSPQGWHFNFSASAPAPPPKPLTVLLALSRPPVMRRLLRDLSSVGCQSVLIFKGQLSEGDYRKSHLWAQIPLLLREGAEQGGQTHLPRWQQFDCLAAALERAGAGGLWCDCRAEQPLLHQPLRWPLALAIGPERGWSELERRLAAQSAWLPVSLGQAALRGEFAAQVAVGLLCQRLEFG